ncbi:hypothetical protein QYF36_005715 [Acer negundo]|nr:hypothetical protein QYF36_005715 [Acer negundo]
MTRYGKTRQDSKSSTVKETVMAKEPKIPSQIVLMRKVKKEHRKGYSRPAKKRTNMNVSTGRKGKRKTSEVTDPAEVYQGDEPIIGGEVKIDHPEDPDGDLVTWEIYSGKRKAISHSSKSALNEHTNEGGRVGSIPVFVVDPMPKKDKQ